MLYKFKSRATSDLIMLEPVGRRMVQIIGKGDATQGILLASQIAAAVSALETAMAAEDAAAAQAHAENPDEDEDSQRSTQAVSLRQRAAPFIDMLRRSEAEGRDVTWGV
jgi:hypothetical protein